MNPDVEGHFLTIHLIDCPWPCFLPPSIIVCNMSAAVTSFQDLYYLAESFALGSDGDSEGEGFLSASFT